MIGRRALIGGGLMLLWSPVVFARSPLIREVYGDRDITEDLVSLQLPALAENGNSVSFTVEVDSPLTDFDFCHSVRIFAPENPVPEVGNFTFSPASGRARVATRIRLSDTQTITAVAEMNDGSLFAGSAETIVTLAACIEPLI